MSRGRSGLQTLLFAALALLVAVSFVARRTGLLQGGDPAFDPALFDDAPRVDAVDAPSVVGEDAVVCGRVVNGVFASATGGQPTFLNLERAYPDQPFDVVVWGRDRGRFTPPPEVFYPGRTICVAGRVTTHEGVPRIEARTPAQISVRRAPGGGP